jgi:RHH-type rel operon transcriptional repressor/antitoxin RelB
MSSILSIRLDSEVKAKLETLAKSSRRSKSFLAAEAIAAYVEAEAWQISEIHEGMRELDAGDGIEHERVGKWLQSWGKKNERRFPR